MQRRRALSIPTPPGSHFRRTSAFPCLRDEVFSQPTPSILAAPPFTAFTRSLPPAVARCLRRPRSSPAESSPIRRAVLRRRRAGAPFSGNLAQLLPARALLLRRCRAAAKAPALTPRTTPGAGDPGIPAHGGCLARARARAGECEPVLCVAALAGEGVGEGREASGARTSNGWKTGWPLRSKRITVMTKAHMQRNITAPMTIGAAIHSAAHTARWPFQSSRQVWVRSSPSSRGRTGPT